MLVVEIKFKHILVLSPSYFTQNFYVGFFVRKKRKEEEETIN